jgi:hypothetical protein
MTETLLSVGSGLLGVILGVTSSWLLVRRQHQLTITLDLHREFNSGQMARSRHVAGKLVLEHHNKTYLELYQQLSPEQMQDIWNVVYFYQRLWLLIKHGHIRKDYVKELFADVFYYWLTISFQSQLVPIETHSAHHIADLRDWMDGHTTDEERRRWSEAAATWDRLDDGREA